MPEVVTTLSPFLIAESISCTFLRCRDCGRITRKYMMPNISAKGTMKVPKPPKGLPACQNQNAAKFIFLVCNRTLSEPSAIQSSRSSALVALSREKNRHVSGKFLRFSCPLDSRPETRPGAGSHSLATDQTRPQHFASGCTLIVADTQLCSEFIKLSKRDSLSNLTHCVKVKVDVVVGGQDGGGDLSGGEEMPQVSAGVAATHAARAIGVHGPLIRDVARVLDVHAAFAGVEAGVARGARGQHAIHHVNAAGNVIGKLLWAPHTHQVARLFYRKKCCHLRGHFTS